MNGDPKYRDTKPFQAIQGLTKGSDSYGNGVFIVIKCLFVMNRTW